MADLVSTTRSSPKSSLIASDACGEPAIVAAARGTIEQNKSSSTLIFHPDVTTGNSAFTPRTSTRRAGRSKAPKTKVVPPQKRPRDNSNAKKAQDPNDSGTAPLNANSLHALATDSLTLPAVSAYFLTLMTQHPPSTSPSTKRPRVAKEIGQHSKAISDVALSFSLEYGVYGKRYRFNPPAPTILIPTHLPHLTEFIEAYVENFDRGRIDYAIGIVHPGATTSHFPPTTSALPEKKPRLPYQAYLLVVEAKRSQDVDSAKAQLFGYLAVLHKLRKRNGGTTSSREVYGIATDGLQWDFLRITEDGVMQVGRRIELEEGTEEIRSVVGAVVGILQKEVEVVRIVKSARGSRVASGERPTLKQPLVEEGGCQVHVGQREEVVGIPFFGSTLKDALVDVEAGATGDVLVDAEALDIRDTEYVKGNVEENSF
ncbi:hypothetical protein EV426DRAFT_714073 [Tirmania nivea]|nr:hypothetical protein EV426DRAFT_714073 [Tirmania nivea]